MSDDGRIERRRRKRRKANGRWILVLTIFVATAIALWFFAFPPLDRIINNPAVGR